MPHKKQKAIRSNKKCYLRPNDRFGFRVWPERNGDIVPHGRPCFWCGQCLSSHPSVVVSHAVHCLSHLVDMWHDVAADCVVIMLAFRPKRMSHSADALVRFGRKSVARQSFLSNSVVRTYYIFVFGESRCLP